MLVMRGGHRFPWPVIWALALAAGSAACASTGAVPKPFPMPGGSAPAPAAPTDAASAPGPRPAPAPPRGPRSAIDGYALVDSGRAKFQGLAGSTDMEQTLLLNASYEPLKIVHWQKAITLWCQGKVEVISCLRPRDPGRFVQLQAAVGHPPAALHQDQAPLRLRAVLAREHLRARRPPLPVLRRRVSRPAS